MNLNSAQMGAIGVRFSGEGKTCFTRGAVPPMGLAQLINYE
jgi:hypothetical protein